MEDDFFAATTGFFAAGFEAFPLDDAGMPPFLEAEAEALVLDGGAFIVAAPRFAEALTAGFGAAFEIDFKGFFDFTNAAFVAGFLLAITPTPRST